VENSCLACSLKNRKKIGVTKTYKMGNIISFSYFFFSVDITFHFNNNNNMRGASLFVLALALLCQIASSSPVSALQKRGGALDGSGVGGTAVAEEAPVGDGGSSFEDFIDDIIYGSL
jgi:hypothetical protein